MNSAAVAQGNDRQTFAPLGPFVFQAEDKVSLKPDGSYLFQHTDGDLVFEAQIAPDVRIVDNFDRAMERVLDNEAAARIRLLDLWHVSDRLRMFDEASNPVRTPAHPAEGRSSSPGSRIDPRRIPRMPLTDSCEVRSRCG